MNKVMLMPEASLELQLDRRCIATEAKRVYEISLGQYFRSPGSSELEARIELLRRLLEEVDLPALRAAYPELRGGGDSVVRILRQGDELSIEAEGRTLHTQNLASST
ncbi:MAG: hypothetical protein K9K39_02175 [Desulfohalobiaceae bacterium]|nr:hypothetical protein [Desulfohalobiaceae bacterium]